MQANREKFEFDIKRGEVGEELVRNILNKSCKTKCVVDASKDKYFQDKDIDFLQILNDGNINRIEVKTDYLAHKTGNMAYETWSNRNEGCLSRSDASLIFYYIYETKEMYVFNLQVLREYLFQTFSESEEIKMGDGARGYLIKISDLVSKGILKQLKI